MNRDEYFSTPEVMRALHKLLVLCEHSENEGDRNRILDSLGGAQRKLSLVSFRGLGFEREAKRDEFERVEIASSAGPIWIDARSVRLQNQKAQNLLENEVDSKIREIVAEIDPDAIVAIDNRVLTGNSIFDLISEAGRKVAEELGLTFLERIASDDSLSSKHSTRHAHKNHAGEGELIDISVDGRLCGSMSKSQGRQLRNCIDERTHETFHLRRPPLDAQLRRFVERAGPNARPSATPDERSALCRGLVDFALVTDIDDWPTSLLDDDPERPYAAHCLHDDPSGWSLASIVTAYQSATPPHDHEGWGVAATVFGVECNTRYFGSCPDRLEKIGEEFIPRGGGYIFNTGDIHQASDASGRTVSLHLIIGGGSRAIQHCPEPNQDN